ncbi:monocarboxylate transporter 12-like [Octopus vulgaris]|uniref:Monocarboxylate transporter 12-like n=2 Tax=Octopus TaxID=6643 RepID=A0AA36AM38_OCTVU|nr:monocarboxylate transporter 12 [Octopus sinensis]CAI9718524.1 monocarboxylate transporter 12-like [Octopus vulgaris]
MNCLKKSEDSQTYSKKVHPVETKPTSELKAPDGGWGWFIVLASALTHAIIGGQERSGGILYLELLRKFNKSSTETAWVTSLSGALRLLCGPLASFLGSRFSLRKVSFVGGIFLSLGFLLGSFSDTLVWFFFAYSFLGGFGKSLSYTSCLVAVGRYFDKRRGLAVGLATAGVGIGMFIFPPLMEWLFQTYGFFGGILLMSGISLNLCVFSMLYRPLHQYQLTVKTSWETPSPQVDQEHVELLPATTKVNECETEDNNTKNNQLSKTVFSPAPVTLGVTPERPNRVSIAHSINYEPITSRNNGCLPSLKRFLLGNKKAENNQPLFDCTLLKDLHFALFLFSICLQTLAFQSVSIFIPPLAKQRGVDTMNAAFLISILGITDIISRIGISSILDLKYIKPYRRYCYTLICFLNGLIVFLYPLAFEYSEFIAITAAYGFMSGAFVSQKSVIIVDLLGVEKLSSSFGWTNCFQGLGALIGPPIEGKLKDTFVLYDYTFYFSSAVIFIGACLLLISNIIYYYRLKQASATTNEDS